MQSVNVYQQVLALDARYNVHRAPNCPNFRTQYIRRRSQLLRESAKEQKDSSVRKQYLRLRAQLLSQRYGPTQSEGSTRGSVSARSMSRLTLEGDPDMSLLSHKTSNADNNPSLSVGAHGPTTSGPSSIIVPTSAAEASRALVGDTSIAENYSFAGVHQLFENHTDTITRIRFANNDRNRLAAASLDGHLSIWHIDDSAAKSVMVLKLEGHTSGVTDFCWSSSNDLLVSCSNDATVRVWHPMSGECIRVVSDESAANIPILCSLFQPINNNLVMTGNQKGLVQVVNISTGKHLKTGTCKTSGAALCLCCESNGKILWVGDDRGYVFSFAMDVTSGKLVKGRKMLVCQGRAITSISARTWISREAPNPTILISVAANMFCLYRIVNNSDGTLQFRKKFPIKHSRGLVRSNFCPLMSFRQGACVLSGSEDSCVYLFDVERGGDIAGGGPQACLNKLQGHTQPVTDVCFNYDESFLASGDAHGVVIVWKREQNNVRHITHQQQLPIP